MIFLSKYKYVSASELVTFTDIPYPQRARIIPGIYDNVARGLKYVPHVVADMVVTKELVEYVKSNPVPGKTGFILAAGSQGWAGVQGKKDIKREGMLYYVYKMPILTLTNIYAGRVASVFGVEDYVATDGCACASSIKVMMDVQNLINMYGFDRVIVLAMEDQVNNVTMEFFGTAKANLSLREEENGAISSAFDAVNYGFNLGQGAAVAIFESDRVADNPEAKLLGAYTASEQFDNPLGQRPDGQGYRKAIEGALYVAKINPKDVTIVKTHGTGTVVNNTAEKAAITAVFDEFIATSYKPTIGHTLAASGLLETGMLLDDIKRGVLPGIANRTEVDHKFISHDTPTSGGVFVSLAAGMGNTYSAAVFSTEV